MELSLQNVGIINRATIQLNGLTVICGSNNSGKSTAGKALYTTIESLSNLEEKLRDELVSIYRRTFLNISRLLDLNSLEKYVDFGRIESVYQKDLSVLFDIRPSFQIAFENTNITERFTNLSESVSLLSPEVLLSFVKKPKCELPKRFSTVLNNYKENRERALSQLKRLNVYFSEDIQAYAEKSVSALFETEFNGQVYPVNQKTKEKKSLISITHNGEVGCSFSLVEKQGIQTKLFERKLLLHNAIYIEDPYALDKISDNGLSSVFRMRDRLDYSHGSKLDSLLLKRETNSLIEQSIIQDRYNEIISKISVIIPGVLSVRESGIYYEEANREPLKVQNLATGSKMFSIIKNLLQKGEINFDTMLILDEPEAHLHPAWQNAFAEIIVLIVKELDTHILLTTHSPNFLMALEAFSKKYGLQEKSNYYMAKHIDNQYMVDYVCVNGKISDIYSSFALPLVEVKKIKDS